MSEPRGFAATTFPILAIDVGTVIAIDGGTVLIEYASGRFARYFHVNDIEVGLGDQVSRGSQIGTGRAW